MSWVETAPKLNILDSTNTSSLTLSPPTKSCTILTAMGSWQGRKLKLYLSSVGSTQVMLLQSDFLSTLQSGVDSTLLVKLARETVMYCAMLVITLQVGVTMPAAKQHTQIIYNSLCMYYNQRAEYPQIIIYVASQAN